MDIELRRWHVCPLCSKDGLSFEEHQAHTNKWPSKRECLDAASEFVSADHCKAAFYKGARWVMQRMDVKP